MASVADPSRGRPTKPPHGTRPRRRDVPSPAPPAARPYRRHERRRRRRANPAPSRTRPACSREAAGEACGGRLERIVQARIEDDEIRPAAARARHAVEHALQRDALRHESRGRTAVGIDGDQQRVARGLQAVSGEVEESGATGTEPPVEFGERRFHLRFGQVRIAHHFEAERGERVAHAACVVDGARERMRAILRVADHERDARRGGAPCPRYRQRVRWKAEPQARSARLARHCTPIVPNMHTIKSFRHIFTPCLSGIEDS